MPEAWRLTVAALLNRMDCARLMGALKRANTTPSMHMSMREEQMTCRRVVEWQGANAQVEKWEVAGGWGGERCVAEAKALHAN